MTELRALPANALTVDVEEHFQVSAFEGTIDRASWAAIPSRVEANTARLLELFGRLGVRATFFVLGWVAERKPSIVRAIAEDGHEVGCHGWSHRLIYRQTPREFLEETLRARRLLQDLSGQNVAGYRAASFSIRRDSLFALDTLVEAGFAYDSSVFPVRHDRYGMPGAPRHVHRLRAPSGGAIVEIPPSTVQIGGLVLPVGGGGYLRLYPVGVTRWAVSRLNRLEGMPAVIYLHPWEADPGQPRVHAPLASRFRHYVGLGSTVRKIEDLATRFPFGPMRDLAGLADARADVVPS